MLTSHSAELVDPGTPAPNPASMEIEIGKVAFIGSYLPRKCGIATFTSDLSRSVAAKFPSSSCSVLSINDTPAGYDRPQTNDVFLTREGHMYMIDRNRGMHILERT